jgi:polyferredoxin
MTFITWNRNERWLCPIWFLGKMYQRVGKYNKRQKTMPNDHKIYQMAIKVTTKL